MPKYESPDQRSLKDPPIFCQYASGSCDQEFKDQATSSAVFLYPSEPTHIASTIESAVSLLRNRVPHQKWKTWKEFPVTGQIVFCEICKKMRFADFIISDVTTLNFNLLFEIGFGIGLGMPMVPIRDTTILSNRREFEELGLLDTVGYVDFQNSEALADSIAARMPFRALPTSNEKVNLDSPIYLLKGHIETDGALRMISVLNRSNVKFRTFDALEVSRISLWEARKQVSISLAVVAHLLSPERTGAIVHNARCALVAGLAMAQGKNVLLLQEGKFQQPLDYRDVVATYSTAEQVSALLDRAVLQVIRRQQDAKIRAIKPPANVLERLDLGDVAAENEIEALKGYFVRTAQFYEARRGKARLVVGRKGSGKTAIFYTMLDQLKNRRTCLVLDLKPEGHQFTELRESVLSKLSPGFQEHTLTAFWNYILLCEIAHQATIADFSWAQLDPGRHAKFEALGAVYADHANCEPGDFSERLLQKVARITARYQSAGDIASPGELTKSLFQDDIRALDHAVAEYLKEKDEVWILIDNLDKGWPTRGASGADILILRTLLDATRKLQRQLSDPDIDFHCLVFLRNDICEHLIAESPDKGKDSIVALDYDDREIFKEIAFQRLRTSTGLNGSFEYLWAAVFDTHIGTQDSFDFILERTLMRPRDLLNFLRTAVEVAINRGHDRVKQEDILKAEEVFSEDILLSVAFEIRDVYPRVSEPLYGFLGCSVRLDLPSLFDILRKTGFQEGDHDKVMRLLVWFGFLGVQSKDGQASRFSYQVRHNIDKLLAPVTRSEASLTVHPAFRKALECTNANQGKLFD